MMYKAILTFSSILVLAVAGSAQTDGGVDPSPQQPPSNFSSMTSQVYPSGTPVISIPPSASGGNYSYTNETRPKSGNCYQPANPNVQPPSSSGVYSSAVPKPDDTNSTCQPDFGSMTGIPTGTASIPSFSGPAYPTTNVSKPMGPNGTYSGNFTLVPPTPSSKPFASGPDEQNPPPISSATPTASFVGRRRLVRRV